MKIKRDALSSQRQIAELANAITTCEDGPLVPHCFEEFGDVGDHARSLRDEVRLLKNDLPLLLLKSSAPELAELITRLKTCAGYVQKVTELEAQIQSALQLMSQFDQAVLDLGAHVGDMVAQAEYR